MNNNNDSNNYKNNNIYNTITNINNTNSKLKFNYQTTNIHANLPPDLDIIFLGTNQYYDSYDRCLCEYNNIGKFIESTNNINNNPYHLNVDTAFNSPLTGGFYSICLLKIPNLFTAQFYNYNDINRFYGSFTITNMNITVPLSSSSSLSTESSSLSSSSSSVSCNCEQYGCQTRMKQIFEEIDSPVSSSSSSPYFEYYSWDSFNGEATFKFNVTLSQSEYICINIHNAQANYNGNSTMEYFHYHQSSSSDPHNVEIFESDLSIAFYGTDQYYDNSDTYSCVCGSENIGRFNMGFNIGGFNPPLKSGFNAICLINSCDVFKKYKQCNKNKIQYFVGEFRISYLNITSQPSVLLSSSLSSIFLSLLLLLFISFIIIITIAFGVVIGIYLFFREIIKKISRCIVSYSHQRASYTALTVIPSETIFSEEDNSCIELSTFSTFQSSSLLSSSSSSSIESSSSATKLPSNFLPISSRLTSIYQSSSLSSSIPPSSSSSLLIQDAILIDEDIDL
jgi:hypothetical protein